MKMLRSALFALALSAGWVAPSALLHAQTQQGPQSQTLPTQTGPQPPAQQLQVPPPPPRQSVTEDMLLRENDRIIGRVSIPDAKLGYLEQPQGRTWRVFKENWAPWILGLAVILTLLIVVVVYMLRGSQRYERDGSSIRLIRYSSIERFNHWMTATSFIVLALTGLNYVFGKRLLMPLMSPEAFGGFSQFAKYAHNFFAWPFVLGVLIMIAVWTRDNLPRRVDLAWLRAGGGFGPNAAHLSAGRFNAGQKLLFWVVVLSTIIIFGSGLALMFPLTFLDVNGMQLWGAVHSIAAALFIAMIIGHIYIGTAGTEGAFGGMGTGEVDLAWARHHHDLWAQEAVRKSPEEPASPSPVYVTPPVRRT